MTVQKILVPVSDPESPGSAVEFAISLARPLDAALTLLHVVDEEGPQQEDTGEASESDVAASVDNGVETSRSKVASDLGQVSIGPATGETAELAEKQLSEYLSLAGTGNLPIAISILAGEPAERIPSMAHQGEFDLVVMEGVRTSRLAKMLFGSTLDSVEQSLEIPVVMLQPDEDETHNAASVPDAVIVPLDRQPDSEHVVETAIELAGQLNASIEFVTAISNAVYVAHPASPLGAPVTVASEAEQQEAKEYLDRFVAIAEESNLPARATVMTGDVVSVVEKAAEPFRNALIVTDTSERSGISRLLLGKVFEDLVLRTNNPVMVVPQPIGSVID